MHIKNSISFLFTTHALVVAWSVFHGFCCVINETWNIRAGRYGKNNNLFIFLSYRLISMLDLSYVYIFFYSYKNHLNYLLRFITLRTRNSLCFYSCTISFIKHKSFTVRLQRSQFWKIFFYSLPGPTVLHIFTKLFLICPVFSFRSFGKC